MARKDIFDRIDSKMRSQLAGLNRSPRKEEEQEDTSYVEKRVSRRVIRRRARKDKPAPAETPIAAQAEAEEPAFDEPTAAEEAPVAAESDEAPPVIEEPSAETAPAEEPSADEPSAEAAPEPVADAEPAKPVDEAPEAEAAPAEEPAAEPESAPEPAPAEESAAASEAAPEPGTAAEPAEEAATVEPATTSPEPAAEPVAEPDAAPPETAVEPAGAPAAEPGVEPAAEPAAEPVAEPAAEPADEPVAEPAEEPVAAEPPAAEPAAPAAAEVETPAPAADSSVAAEIAASPESVALEDLLREQGIVQHKPKKGRRIITEAPLAERRPIPKPVIRHDIRAQQLMRQARDQSFGGAAAGAPAGDAGQPRDGGRRRTPGDERFERDLRAEREREKKLQMANRRKKGRRRKSIVQRPDMMYYPDRRNKRKKTRSSGPIVRMPATIPKAAKRVIRIENEISVGELAKELGLKSSDLIRKFIELGQMVTVNQFVDFETATLVAAEFDYRVENVAFNEEEILVAEDDAPEDLQPRPPVITVMGHVDHGKTSILDTIRNSRVAAREAGGITQHIGAYQVDVNGSLLTFLDTPGHEAFTAMRARGAQATDLVVLVVAANDGVMPQTIEAIDHARAAEVPILVAINKIDLANTNIDRVKQELAEQGLQAEDWGGDTVMVPVSATKNIGIDDLLEMIALQAEMLELGANPEVDARGVVIEAKLSKGVGPVATVLIQHGTLRTGDFVIAGTAYGKVRAMNDHAGKRTKVATPATPVEIHGLSEVPDAGDEVWVVEGERQAKEIAEHRLEEARSQTLSKSSRVTMEMLSETLAAQDRKELNIVLKADVHGSVEALKEAIQQIDVDDTEIKLRRAVVGGITENDVLLIAASGGLVVGFGVRPDAKANKMAERQGVEIRTYRVIYEVLEDIEKLLKGLLDPIFKEEVKSSVEVRETFKIPKIGQIAGCFVTDGQIARSHQVRLLRQSKVIWEGKLASLKRFKDDVKEVSSGYECGIGLQDYHDIKKGDVIESFVMVEVERS